MRKSHGEAVTVEDAREQYDEVFENAGKTEGAMSPEELEEYGKEVEAAVRGSAAAEVVPADEPEQVQAESAEAVLNTAEAGKEQPARPEAAEGGGEGENAPDEAATQEAVELTPSAPSVAEAVPDDGKVHTQAEYREARNSYSRGTGKVRFGAGLAVLGSGALSIGGAAASVASITASFPPLALLVGGGYAVVQGVRYIKYRRRVSDFERKQHEKLYEQQQAFHMSQGLDSEAADRMNTYRKYKPKNKE